MGQREPGARRASAIRAPGGQREAGAGCAGLRSSRQVTGLPGVFWIRTVKLDRALKTLRVVSLG